MQIIKLQIPYEYKNLIQKLDLEVQSRKEIIEYILINNLNISNQRFNEYQNEYDNKLYQFDLLKCEIERQIIQPLIKENQTYNWYLNYITSTLVIEINEKLH